MENQVVGIYRQQTAHFHDLKKFFHDTLTIIYGMLPNSAYFLDKLQAGLYP